MAHLWHGISTGANPPLDINVIIEIPGGSKCKYELDKVAGIIRVDRIIASAVYYPGNYGFIPQTYADDKILCVPLRDPHYQEFKSASDIPQNILSEILEFFRVYKNLEEKKVVIQGVEPLEVAIEIVNKSLENYKEKYLDA
jgi:inorganic pyrophosphatase